jgi:hypothetical protein
MENIYEPSTLSNFFGDDINSWSFLVFQGTKLRKDITLPLIYNEFCKISMRLSIISIMSAVYLVIS